MNILKKKDFLFKKVSNLKGVGIKLTSYLKKKKIDKINDLLLSFPYSYTDRSNLVSLEKLEIGKILTVKVMVKKYNFPRIRNLPSRIVCEDATSEIDLVFFNSREGYLRKILPINDWVVVSGKINFYKKRYQITNPDYVTKVQNIDYVNKVIPKYQLTEGLTEKTYRKIIEQVLDNLPKVEEWHNKKIINKLGLANWNESIKKIHISDAQRDLNSPYYKRLAFDEILSHLLVLSNNRKKLKLIKKKPKSFNKKTHLRITENLNFKLTKSQLKVIDEINNDLLSEKKMFRILQGDVGSGKTIVALITAFNCIISNHQCAIMAPTDILAQQHYTLCLKIFKNENLKIEYLSGKTHYKDRKKIIHNLKIGKIDLIIGTHSLFQKKIEFKNLGYIIIDEQHKFGVNQRMKLSQKGGDDCDVLLMSATPIPRTMMLTIYGDMDISKITEKPSNRKEILTLSKPEDKIDEVLKFVKKQIKEKNQIFWVCPLIDDSKFLNYSSAIKRHEFISSKFHSRVGLIHGSLDKIDKEKILNDFLNKYIDILISTTVIEVGIDFPNANLIIIDNADKFGLAQLHQLRGRVGRGLRQGVCILLFKGALSKNSIKRINILKSSNDGFYIADQDMKLRGFGDIMGFQQSGIKYFKIADPVIHENLFRAAEIHIKELENENIQISNYNFLLKLFDKAEIINDIDLN